MRHLVCIVFLVFPACVDAQTPETRKNHYNVEDGVALEGHDPVSYHSGKPAEGKRQFSYSLDGRTYYFSTEVNKAAFIKDPQKYEPAYGGWCAYAMGKTGEKVKIDPETFKLIEGRLYLFYNFWGNNTLEDWNKDERILKSSADQQWKKYVNR